MRCLTSKHHTSVQNPVAWRWSRYYPASTDNFSGYVRGSMGPPGTYGIRLAGACRGCHAQPARSVRGRPRTQPYRVVSAATDTTLWTEAAESYLTACAGRGLTPTTLMLYRHFLLGGPTPESQRTRLFLAEQGVARDRVPRLVTERPRCRTLRGPAVAIHGVDVRKTIRSFLSWCAAQGWASTPALRASPPPSWAAAARSCRPRRSPRCSLPPPPPRDRLIAEVFLSTGLRLEEVAAFCVGDLIAEPVDDLPACARQGRQGPHRPPRRQDPADQSPAARLHRHRAQEGRHQRCAVPGSHRQAPEP